MPTSLSVALAMAILLFASIIPAEESHQSSTDEKLNVIDQCWRLDPQWHNHRQRLAGCSVGFAGKMMHNIGRDVTRYIVTDSSDDPTNPKPGTLRYGATHLKGKVWITFRRDMKINLKRPLLVSNFTAIDGRGAEVHIEGGGCIMLLKASNVIIHGLNIHHCKKQKPGSVMGPEDRMEYLEYIDGDAITLLASNNIWIDHNTLSECADGLIDVTFGSTDITISNNRFKNHEMVMLLGHDDAYLQDKNMRVTVALNHFGPGCNQRMPRVRHGFANVVNNLYQGWGLYAIGGTMNPSITSEANLYIAKDKGLKEVARKMYGKGDTWNFYSVKDLFENGAVFTQTGVDGIMPHYNRRQVFQVADAASVRSLTRSAGALSCHKGHRC